MTATPIKAATVILLRDTAGGPPEVFLLKRHDANPFMGGLFVYPGGKIEREDRAAAAAPGAAPLLRQREYRAASRIPRDEHIAACCAVIRELFEEAHVLIGRIAGCPAAAPEAAVIEHLRHCARHRTDGRGFSAMLEDAGVQPAIGELYYCANWITPEGRPIRFDTHFFVARLPAGQDAVADPRESSTGLWITPKEALAGNLRGTIPLSPPTLKTIEDIAAFRTIDQLLSSLPSDPVSPVLPVFVESAARTLLVFPWDADYEAYRAGEPEGPGGNGAVSSPGGTTTRLELTGDRWVPYSKSR
jgi:8-oxo-dGTP pyrophosphatase MutT (NUDIX family)